ncbi:MAG: phasin family protein [Aquisalimonadaceae bacterium]
MYTELFSKANHQLEDMMQPARRLQGAMVDHMAKVTDFQLDTLRGYSELGMKELRALQDVNDPQSLQNFMSQHAELLRTFSEKISRDMNEMVKLQRHFAEDLQKVGRESASRVVQAAESTAEETARAASQTAERGAEATKESAEGASRAAKSAGEETPPKAQESGSGKSSGSGSRSGSESGKRSA